MEKNKHCLGTKMNHLVIYANPDPKSLSAEYKNIVVQLTEMSRNVVNVRDLYNVRFSPVLEKRELDALRCGQIAQDVKVEQDYILWADLITFIYPVWWVGMPAVLKGYIDRVFTQGFAYGMDEKARFQGLLANKKVVILNNMGSSYDRYNKNGMLNTLRQSTDEGIFEFCGMEVVEHRFFGHINTDSKHECEAHIEVLKLIYDKIFSKY